MRFDERACRQCGRAIPYYYRVDAIYCGAACKQAAYRARQAEDVTDTAADVTPNRPTVTLVRL